MKVPYTLAFSTLTGLFGIASAQVIDTSNFFNPAFSVRQPGATSGLLDVIATNAPATATGSSTNIGWSHSAGGLIQARTELTLGIPLALLDAQLFATTRTTGSSLVFGRDISLQAQLLTGTVIDTSGPLNGLLNTLVAANAVYNWSSTATLGGVDIQANQLYQVSFNVTDSAGLPAGVIGSLNFGIENDSVTSSTGGSATLLNVLDVITIGDGENVSPYTFVFQSSENLTELELNFAAQSVVGANLLGGTGARDYLTFSNVSIVAVPEPAALTSFGLFAAMLGFRRRRN